MGGTAAQGPGASRMTAPPTPLADMLAAIRDMLIWGGVTLVTALIIAVLCAFVIAFARR